MRQFPGPMKHLKEKKISCCNPGSPRIPEYVTNVTILWAYNKPNLNLKEENSKEGKRNECKEGKMDHTTYSNPPQDAEHSQYLTAHWTSSPPLFKI